MKKNKKIIKKEKALQKAFNNSKLIDNMLAEPNGLKFIGENLTKILIYYMATEDKKTDYTIDEFEHKFYLMQTRESKAIKYKTLKERWWTHSFNGFFEKTALTYGLGDKKHFLPEIKKALEYLENNVEKNLPFENQLGDKLDLPETYVALLGSTTIEYAIDLSPERVFSGPFHQEESLPIVVGEKKTDYYMRVLLNKIKDLNISEKKRKAIIENGKKVIDAFCTMRPRIAIIPESEIEDYKIAITPLECNDFECIEKIEKSSSKKKLLEKLNTLKEYVEHYKDVIPLAYCNDINEIILNNCNNGGSCTIYDDIPILGKVIPKEKFGVFSIPDSFEIIQKYAIQRGAEYGDIIDANTGEIVHKAIPLYQPYEKNNSIVGNAAHILGRMKDTNKYALTGEAKNRHISEIYEYSDPNKQYLFKFAENKNSKEKELYREYVQIAASRIQQWLIPDRAVNVKIANIWNEFGTVQDKININEEKTNMIEQYQKGKIETLPLHMFQQIMQEYIVDYLLCNYDSNAKNFIVDLTGKVRGIDKANSFKCAGRYATDIAFKENPNKEKNEMPSIYNKILKEIYEGKIPFKSVEKVYSLIEKVKSMSEEEYKTIFEEYKASLPEEKRANVENEIIQRKRDIVKIENMIKELRIKSINKSVNRLFEKHDNNENKIFENDERA